MSLLVPFRGERVTPAWAPSVVAPSVDVLSDDQVEAMLTANPHSFLNVTRSPPTVAETHTFLARNREQLNNLRALEAFESAADGQPAVHVYRLSSPTHVQTAVVAEVPVSAILDGTILPHEATRVERVGVLADTLREVKAVSSPVALGFRDGPGWLATIARCTATAPQLDFSAVDDVRQQIWTITGDEAAALVAEVGDGPMYVIDGHHRCAAATAFRDQVGADVEGSHQRLLVAAFPTGELQMAGFNRLVKLDRSADDALDVLRGVGDLREANSPVSPDGPGVFGVYAAGSWFRLQVPIESSASGDPVASLDVSVLHDQVLATGFGMTDVTADPRLSFLPGGLDLDNFLAHCDSSGSLGFVVAPAQIEDLMGVADAGRVMPPKSTYFHPKVRSGVFLVDRS